MYRKKYDDQIKLATSKRAVIKEKYLIDNPLGILVYVDHLHVNNTDLYFNEGIKVDCESRREKFRRVLKNGQVKYSERSVKYLVFTAGTSTNEVVVDAKVAEIRQAISLIKKAIEEYPETKNDLDQQLLKLDGEIVDVKRNKDREIRKINNRADKIIQEYQSAIDNFVAKASPNQLRELHKGRTMLVRVAKIGAILFVILAIVGGILMSIEKGRDYFINVDNEYTFDCDLFYDSTDEHFSCMDRSVNGSFSKYDTVELRGDSLTVNGDQFIVDVSSSNITPNLYQTEDFSTDEIVSKYGKTKQNVEIYNTYLKEIVLSKEITVHWNFSEDDLKLLSDRNQQWRDAEAKKAAEAKAEEERKAAEAKQKADEEAAAKAAEERRVAEEAQRRASQTRQQTQQTPTTTNSTTSTSSGGSQTNVNNTGNSGNLPLKAICRDGTVSYQDDPSLPNYRGMCSKHGGIAQKLGRVP